MRDLISLVLVENKTGEEDTAGMMAYESAGVSDKQNCKHWLKFMPGFLISLQGFRDKNEFSLKYLLIFVCFVKHIGAGNY